MDDLEDLLGRPHIRAELHRTRKTGSALKPFLSRGH